MYLLLLLLFLIALSKIIELTTIAKTIVVALSRNSEKISVTLYAYESVKH